MRGSFDDFLNATIPITSAIGARTRPSAQKPMLKIPTTIEAIARPDLRAPAAGKAPKPDGPTLAFRGDPQRLHTPASTQLSKLHLGHRTLSIGRNREKKSTNRISSCLDVKSKGRLLQLDAIAGMDLGRRPGDDNCRSLFLYVQHDGVAGDLSHILRPAALSFVDRHFVSAGVRARLARRLVREFAPFVSFALKAVVASSYCLILGRVVWISVSERTIDGKVIADVDVVVGAEIDINDEVSRYHLGRVSRHQDTARRFARVIGKQVQRRTLFIRRACAWLDQLNEIAEQKAVAR